MKSFNEQSEIIQENLITSAFTTTSALLIAKKLYQPIKETQAYKFGLIDEKSKRTNKQPATNEEKESINLFNMFIFDLKRIFLFFVSEGILKILITVYLIKNIKR